MPFSDKEKQRVYNRQYQRRDERKAYKKEWDKRNRERLAEMQRQRYKADPEKYRRYFRNHRIKKVYGITAEQYDRMFGDQGGVCAICGSCPNKSKHGLTMLAIDHCHKTGAVRGLLCNNCNAGMGILGDTAEHLEAALAYLKKHVEKENR